MQAEASTQKVRAGCRGIHRAGTWPRTYLHDAYQQEVAVRWAMELLKDVLEYEVGGRVVRGAHAVAHVRIVLGGAGVVHRHHAAGPLFLAHGSSVVLRGRWRTLLVACATSDRSCATSDCS
jgi:hypothetical protein